MKKLALILGAVLVLGACTPKPRLVIVHVNDTHSHFEPERSGPNTGLGGIIERAAFVDSVRKANPGRTLVVHGGDFGQGTSYFTVLEGVVETEMMNAINYDVAALGNHEFDNGIEALTERVKQMSTPLVCANLDLAPFELGKYVKPYVILKKGRMKVGVIGLTADLSTNVSRTISSRIQQLDAAEAVNKCLDAIRDSCDLVILLSHYGFEEDKALVPQTRGLDLVVGAHSHIFMDAMEDLVDADGRTVPMITDGCYGKEVGVVKVW